MTKKSSASYTDTKPHYNVLNGLRGIAAIMVLWYHVFEAFATSALDQVINHGYLAVDFFFVLSGFVIGYAYDDRWQSMGIGNFLKRRLIRLQPMVVLGALIGAGMFYLQDYSLWKVSEVTIWMLFGAMLLNILLIPATPTTEIRGLGEMYPLNGPTWSLLFEYLGNILYAIFIRRLPTKALAILVILLGGGLAYFALLGEGYLGVGWTMNSENMIGGSLRFLFSFSAGLLLSRVFVPIKIKWAFWIGALLIILLTAMPRIGSEERFWLNGIYDLTCVLVLFSLIVYLGASERALDSATSRVCSFLGDISYPLYMVHYPFIYLYYAWVKNNELTFADSLPWALTLVFGCIILAYLSLKLYDESLRKYLSRRFLKK